MAWTPPFNWHQCAEMKVCQTRPPNNGSVHAISAILCGNFDTYESKKIFMSLSSIKIHVAIITNIPPMFRVRTNMCENHISMDGATKYDITPEILPRMLEGSGRG